MLQAAFLLWLRRRFFPGVPVWVASMCILVLGLSTPYTWMLGSQAAPHNAAIAAGQAFFTAGLWMALEALTGSRVRTGMAIAAGALWVGAIGSRLTQVIPVAVMIVLIQVHLAREGAQRGQARFNFREVVPFAWPLVLGVCALGWYNWARFGSVLETGMSYQLAMLPIERYAHDLFSARYLPQDLYNYLFEFRPGRGTPSRTSGPRSARVPGPCVHHPASHLLHRGEHGADLHVPAARVLDPVRIGFRSQANALSGSNRLQQTVRVV